MAEKIILTAQKRTVKGKQVGALRRQGILPGIIYGKLGKKHIDPVMIQLDLHDASQIIKLLTGSSLVTVDVEGKEYPVVLRELQKDIIYGTLRHVDFMAVSLTEKLQTAVPIELIGQAPERIEVDATVLVDMDSAIYVKDLVLPDTVEVLTDPEELIAAVTHVAVEAEPEAEEGELAELLEDEAEPEVIEKGKQEEEAEE